MGPKSAYWPNAETHVAGALQAVPDEPGTEIILESTSEAGKGLFYEMCAAAMRGEGEYILVFIPWFWQREYRKPLPEGFQPTPDELAYQAAYGLDLEQIGLAPRQDRRTERRPQFQAGIPRHAGRGVRGRSAGRALEARARSTTCGSSGVFPS